MATAIAAIELVDRAGTGGGVREKGVEGLRVRANWSALRYLMGATIKQNHRPLTMRVLLLCTVCCAGRHGFCQQEALA